MSQPPPQDAAAWLSARQRVMVRVSTHADGDSIPATLTAGLLEAFGVDLARTKR